MVAVLLSPARVAAGRLKMAVCKWAYPHVGPRGRDAQPVDTLDRRLIANHTFRAVHVDKTFAAPNSTKPRLRVGRVAQTGFFGMQGGTVRDYLGFDLFCHRTGGSTLRLRTPRN